MNKVRRLLAVMVAGGAMLAASGLLAQEAAPSNKVVPALGIKPAEGFTASAEEVEKNLAQLGDEEFVVREAASARLMKMGILAEAGLEKAAASSNREVRVRAQRILVDVRRNEFAKRLKQFFSAPIGSKEVTFPAWDAFQQDFGDSRGSRRLFATMQSVDGEILDSFAQEETRILAINMLQQRIEEYRGMARQGRSVNFAEIVTTYWIATYKGQRMASAQTQQLLQLASTQAWDEQQRDEEVSPIAGKLLGRVILRAEDSQRYLALNLSMQYGLKEGLVVAEQMLADQAKQSVKNRIDQSGRIDPRPAVCVIATMGDKTFIPKLEALLDDRSDLGSEVDGVIGTPNVVRYNLQVRDVALAGIFVLAKAPITEIYKLPSERSSQTIAMTLLQPRLIGFTNDESRQAAMLRWQQMKPKMLSTE
ncbi:MAG: hypothetical protein ACO1RA_20815 [Planctomycetaceae bacterium]